MKDVCDDLFTFAAGIDAHRELAKAQAIKHTYETHNCCPDKHGLSTSLEVSVDHHFAYRGGYVPIQIASMIDVAGRSVFGNNRSAESRLARILEPQMSSERCLRHDIRRAGFIVAEAPGLLRVDRNTTWIILRRRPCGVPIRAIQPDRFQLHD